MFKNPPEGTLFKPGALHRDGLPGSVRTIAEMVKGPSAIIGKWHLGVRPEQMPDKQGFDYAAVILGGGHPYNPGTGPLWVNGRQMSVNKNLTDWLGDQVVDWVNTHDDYFLMFTPNAPHQPLQATPEQMKNCRGNKFCGVMTGMDNAIGRLLDALERKDQLKNTLIWFTADNGCAAGTPCSTGGLRGKKGQAVGEGGVRVPGIVAYQGVIDAGTSYDGVVSLMDIAVTSLAARGGPVPDNLDGINLLPYLKAHDATPLRDLYWAQTPTRGSILRGKWKYYREPRSSLLFNLDTDPGEQNNVVGQYPEVANELSDRLNTWLNSLPKPNF